MKRLILTFAILIIAASAFASDAETWGNAVFDSAAQAYAFAASVESPMVIRTSETPPRYVVYVENRERRRAPSPAPENDKILHIGLATLTSGGTTLTCGGSVQVIGEMDATTHVHADTYIDTSTYFSVLGTQVVGPQQAAVADAEPTVADLTAKLNQLLAAMRAHGLIAK